MNTSTLRTGYMKWLLFLVITTVFISGCKKDDPLPPEPEPTNYEAYVSHKYVTTYSADVIRSMYSNLQLSYPDAAPLIEKVKYGVNVYEVTYKTPFQGNQVEASGLLCIPLSKNGGSFPMISFQNGTNTAHADAPTVNISNLLFQYLHATASMGYLMVIPDYLGFGVSEQIFHPYLHKKSTVASIENLITAVSEMTADSLVTAKWDKTLYLMGYSQGGWSTLCTTYDINKVNSLPFKVKASVCGAGPYSLSIVQNFMFEKVTYPMPVYMAYSGLSYHQLGLITNPLTDYFNEPYASNLSTYFNGQYNGSEINQRLNDTVGVLIASSFLNGINNDPTYEDFRNAMTDNSIAGWNTDIPIRFYHGTADNYVPPATSEQVYQEFENAGAGDKVAYFTLEGLNHSTGAVPTILGGLLWFNQMEEK